MNKKIMELIKSDRFKPLFDQWRLAKKAAEAAAEVAAAFQSFYVPPADGEFDDFDDDAEDEIVRKVDLTPAEASMELPRCLR